MFKKVLFFISITHTILSQPCLHLKEDVLEQLQQAHIWDTSRPLRLHLGCGEAKFKDYINIDFPPSEHTIQTTQGADIFANLITLNFPEQSVAEVRSHHVFEHFDRQTALALAAKWHRWLAIGGKLVIETPDFDASIKMLINRKYTYQQKQSILRHICGSHEAPWAIHCDGWYKDKFERVLTALGFEDITYEFTQWQLTSNIIVRAVKKRCLSNDELKHNAHMILRDSMVDTSPSEEKMWQLWCTQFDALFC